MNFKSYISYFACLLCLLASCMKIEQDEAYNGPKEICFDVIQDRSASTKAAGVYPTGQSFASYAWYLPKGSSWSTSRADAELYINEAEISYDNTSNSWHDLSQKHYWPKNGALTFFSISPASVASSVSLSTNYGFWISQWNVGENQSVDIMVADVQADKTANEVSAGFTGVPTVFRHKLAMIEGFTFNTLKDYAPGHTAYGSYRKDDRRFFIKSIKINNVEQVGRFVSGNSPSSTNIGQWILVDSADDYDYTWFSGNEEIAYSSSSSESIPANALSGGRDNILILPQNFTNPGSVDVLTVPNIEVTYVSWTYTNNSGSYSTHETTARASLYDVLVSVGNRVEMNRKLIFNITINLDSNLILWAPDQNEWTENDFNIGI